MRTKEITLYQIDELSDAARGRARAWYREGAFDFAWYDYIFEDAVTVAGLLGIAIDGRAFLSCGGKVIEEPAISFSGFSAQGDGAQFAGSWRYKRGWRKALTEHAPQDGELFRIGRALQDAARATFYTASANTLEDGRAMHSRRMLVRVYSERGADPEEAISQALRDFANWIYRRLESEYEYLNSDEAVDESIRANEYEFTEDGGRL